MPSRWSHLLTDTVTVQSETSVDASGKSVYGGATRTVRCRVERESRLVPGPDNTELNVEAKLMCEEELKTTDRVWLPGADTGNPQKANRPVQVRAAAIPGGASLFEALL